MTEMTNVQAIAQELANAGIKFVFGQPGGEVVELIEALEQAGLAFILCGHETAAALAAATVGHATGIPGACLTTLGPGACNLALGLGDAYLDRHPMIAISARTATNQADWYNHQALDLHAMYAPITKDSVPLDGINTAVKTAAAIKLAQAFPRGPVFLTLPGDLASKVEMRSEQKSANPPEESLPIGQLDQIVKRLNNAKRPVAILGISLDQIADHTAVVEFLDQTGIPFADTPKTKGLLPPSHPSYLGCALSSSGDRHINALIENSDCIIGIGYDQVETTYTWHLDNDVYCGLVRASTAYGSYQPKYEAVGDVTEMLGYVRQRYDGHSNITAADIAQLHQTILNEITPEQSKTDQGLAPIAAVQILRQRLPANTLMAVDTGQHKMIMGQAWQTDRPLRYFGSNGLSSMSTSVPGAIGLSLLYPDQPVVCLAGDGGFGMMVQELETVKRLGITPLMIVFCDQALSLIRIPQEMRGLPSRGIDLGYVDWVQIAKGYGLDGRWAHTENEIISAVEEWLKAPSGMVLAIQVDEKLYRGNSY